MCISAKGYLSNVLNVTLHMNSEFQRDQDGLQNYIGDQAQLWIDEFGNIKAMAYHHMVEHFSENMRRHSQDISTKIADVINDHLEIMRDQPGSQASTEASLPPFNDLEPQSSEGS